MVDNVFRSFDQAIPVHDSFLHLLIILITARVFAELATRLKSLSLIGELLAGVVLGPSLLGWLDLRILGASSRDRCVAQDAVGIVWFSSS